MPLMHVPQAPRRGGIWLFLLAGCVMALLRDTPARNSRFYDQDHFSVIVSTVEVAKPRMVKTAHPYDLLIIIVIFLIQTVFSELVQ